jgi:hypothetical protein
MQRSLDSEVRSHLVDYLAGEESLQEFRSWFVPNALATVEEQVVDTWTKGLVYTVELHMAEHGHGDWSEQELREQFAELLETRREAVALGAPPASYTTFASAGTTLVQSSTFGNIRVVMSVGPPAGK